MSNEKTVREFLQKVWNEKDFDYIPNYVAPEYTIYMDTADLWEGKTLNHSEFKTRLNYSFSSFPDINFEIVSAITDGNYVAITWIMTGTNSGNIAAFSPTNKTINTNGLTIYHFNDGKICGHTQVFDRTSIMKQLGF
ncbi:MAG: ester cyclase [Bacteroidia bacterium]